MAEKQVINPDLIKEKATRTTRVFCYLDSRISLEFANLARFLEKRFAINALKIQGRFDDSRGFLKKTKEIKENDLFVFFLKITHIEQINELHSKWSRITSRGAKAMFVILDFSMSNFRTNVGSLTNSRYMEMVQHQKTRIILLNGNNFNTNDFEQNIRELLNN